MNQAELKELLLSLQAGSGAFQATVHIGQGSLIDYNGFVTALVLRELEPFAGTEEWAKPLGRALDFLEQCESLIRPGFFSFWPRHLWPEWAPNVPDDADDTAVMASELYSYGRITREEGQSIASAALIPYRLEAAQESGKPWLRCGAFLTWLDHRCEPNPMDCVVNVNILAFLAQVGLSSQPGCREALEMVRDGILWCGRRWGAVGELSPYYPDASELLAAVKNAVRKGASELGSWETELGLFPALAPDDPSKVVFSIADRSTVWSSQALWAARQISSVREHTRCGKKYRD